MACSLPSPGCQGNSKGNERSYFAVGEAWDSFGYTDTDGNVEEDEDDRV